MKSMKMFGAVAVVGILSLTLASAKDQWLHVISGVTRGSMPSCPSIVPESSSAIVCIRRFPSFDYSRMPLSLCALSTG